MDVLIADPFVSGVFLFAGLVCLILEVFLPSGGVLGLVAVASSVFGIYGLFHQGRTGPAFGVIAFFIAAFWTMFRYMIRRLSFPSSLPPDVSTSIDHRIFDLVGKEGLTVTALRPAGMAIIDGKKVDVVTLGDFIEKDLPVRVVDISGNRVVVRLAELRSNRS